MCPSLFLLAANGDINDLNWISYCNFLKLYTKLHKRILPSSQISVVNYLSGSYRVHTNDIVRVSGKESRTIGGPSQARAGRGLAVFRLLDAERIDDNL